MIKGENMKINQDVQVVTMGHVTVERLVNTDVYGDGRFVMTMTPGGNRYVIARERVIGTV